MTKEQQEQFKEAFEEVFECKWPDCGNWPESCESDKCEDE